MTDNNLLAAKKPDNFSSESPTRAFSDFTAGARTAIGKGFRPSFTHLVRYLDALEMKEGWQLVQIIMPETDATDPTMLFRRVPVADCSPVYEVRGKADFAMVEQWLAEHGISLTLDGDGKARLSRPVIADDPLNPKHYAGRACADIGERLSANGYQILKYVWREGKKGDPVEDIGKAIWYAESEYALLNSFTGAASRSIIRPLVAGLKPDGGTDVFLESRIEGQSNFVQEIARSLWCGYTKRTMGELVVTLKNHRDHLLDGRGLAL